MKIDFALKGDDGMKGQIPMTTKLLEIKRKTARAADSCVLFLLVIIAVAVAWAAFGQTQKEADDADAQLLVGKSAPDALDEYFQKAREDFLNNDLNGAATEIRNSTAYLKSAAYGFTGEAKASLLSMSSSNEKLASEIENGKMDSEKGLSVEFARVHQVLSKALYDRAVESMGKRDMSAAGKDLRDAAIALGDAVVWAGHDLEEKLNTAINEAKAVGEGLMGGASGGSSEVKSGIENLGKQIDSSGRKLEKTKFQMGQSMHQGDPKAPTDNLITAIEWVAKRTIPAVVHIEASWTQEVQNAQLPFEHDSYLRRYLDLPNKRPKKFKRERIGLGTGMIMDEAGHILTNNHVVWGAEKIQVLLSNGERFTASIVGTDPKTDLAVIEISSKESLPHVDFGDSDKVEVGQWVVAIGHPRGLDQTVTQGIISAKHREGIMNPTSYQDYLQTDAAINPGNSGGPLLNLQGEVIGVAAAIASQSGGFEGIGFAIPSNMALYVSKELIAKGKVERGWLGVSLQELTEAEAKSFGMKAPKGALVAEVVKDGPSDKAGVEKGDVVVSFGGKPVSDAGDLRNEVASTPVGKDVPLTILRKGEEKTLTVKIGNLEKEVKMLSSTLKDRLGAEYRAVSDKEAMKYDLPPQEGVAISWLDPEGPLGKVGFEEGDLILEVDGVIVPGLEGFLGMLEIFKPHQRLTLLALDHRNGQVGYVQVEAR
jgi:serine protease Do